MLALPGASGVLAATDDESASTGFWAAMDGVGKLYAIKGRQIADDVKTNYLQLAGGDECENLLFLLDGGKLGRRKVLKIDFHRGEEILPLLRLSGSSNSTPPEY